MFSFGLVVSTALFVSCGSPEVSKPVADNTVVASADTMDYFLLRPKLEKKYGYSHAVKIGNHVKISGAVSMDSNGVLAAPGNLEQEMKNCYVDLIKVLARDEKLVSGAILKFPV